MWKLAAWFALCVMASPVLAQNGPSHVRISVEQPVYAGLPVWLDVVADDPCIAVHYFGDLAGDARGGMAEVVDASGQKVARGMPLLQFIHSRPGQRVGACPNPDPSDGPPFPANRGFRSIKRGPSQSQAGASPAPNRVPLHLVADLRKPGHYAVRWVIPFTDELGRLEPTPWLSFVVQPSTAQQRETWLTALLAHPPSDAEEIERDYIPSLLAAWDTPRAEHKLIDFLCSDNDNLSLAIMAAPGAPLSEERLLTLANAIESGCLSSGLVEYVNITSSSPPFSAAMPEKERRRLLVAVVKAVPHADGAHLAHALRMLTDLKGRFHDGYGLTADQAVLLAVPRILGSIEPEGNSMNDPKFALVEYARAFDKVSDRRAVLRALAGQKDRAAGYAVTELMSAGNTGDIAFLRDWLMGPVDRLDVGSVVRELRFIPRRFGTDGVSLLRMLTHADTLEIRTEAEVVLADLGDRAATETILAVLQSGDIPAKGALVLQLMRSPGCAGGGCGWMSGTDTEEVARRNAPTVNRLVTYFEAKLATTP